MVMDVRWWDFLQYVVVSNDGNRRWRRARGNFCVEMYIIDGDAVVEQVMGYCVFSGEQRADESISRSYEISNGTSGEI